MLYPLPFPDIPLEPLRVAIFIMSSKKQGYIPRTRFLFEFMDGSTLLI
jgi:hypothetical protein